MGKPKYIIHIEIARIIAIYFVIFNHTGNLGFFLFSQYAPESLEYWIYMFISIFCKFAVPVFFAISGALLLDKKQETLKRIFGKRICRIIVVLIIFSFLSYLQLIYRGKEKFDLARFFSILVIGDWNGPYWYLYAYIAFLASLPFLRALVQGLEKKYYYYMITIVVFFTGVIPVVEYILYKSTNIINTNIKVSWLMSSIVVYPCIGYFLEHKLCLDEIKRALPILWVTNVVAIALSCWMTHYRAQITGILQIGTSELFFSSFALINCITIYCTVKYVCSKVNFKNRLKNVIFSIGRCTFGIYLLHAIAVKSILGNKLFVFLRELAPSVILFNYMSAVLLYCFIMLLVCFVLTILLKRVPGLNKLL